MIGLFEAIKNDKQVEGKCILTLRLSESCKSQERPNVHI